MRNQNTTIDENTRVSDSFSNIQKTTHQAYTMRSVQAYILLQQRWQRWHFVMLIFYMLAEFVVAIYLFGFHQ